MALMLLSFEMTGPQIINVKELREIISGLGRPKPAVYWADFLISWGILVLSSYVLAIRHFTLDGINVGLFIFATLSAYRAVLFVHELTHLRKGAVPGFTWGWNLLCGVWFLAPHFFYKGVHNEHHNTQTYSTSSDGEYHPFKQEAPLATFVYVFTSLLSPFLLIFRFAIISPLSLFVPKIRSLAKKHLSSLIIDFNYVRTHWAQGKEKRQWLILESIISIWVIFAIYSIATGLIPPNYAYYWYALTVSILVINSLRTLVAHRYALNRDETNFDTQILDSVNIVGGGWVTELWAPVGLRYHGLHHMFAALPYHDLPEAHRRMVKNLSAYPFYEKTFEKGLFSGLKQLLNRSRSDSKSEEFAN